MLIQLSSIWRSEPGHSFINSMVKVLVKVHLLTKWRRFWTVVVCNWASSYTSHSIRIGVATTATLVTLTIQTLGMWHIATFFNIICQNVIWQASQSVIDNYVCHHNSRNVCVLWLSEQICGYIMMHSKWWVRFLSVWRALATGKRSLNRTFMYVIITKHTILLFHSFREIMVGLHQSTSSANHLHAAMGPYPHRLINQISITCK